MIIYIAAPYTPTPNSDETEESNAKSAMEIAYQVYRKGHIPFIPHLSHWWDIYLKQNNSLVDYDDHIRIDLAILERCDAILITRGATTSNGVKIEKEFAETNGILIYWSVDDIPENFPCLGPQSKREAYFRLFLPMLTKSFQKNQDYSPLNIALTGLEGLATRILDKALRFRSIMKRGYEAVKGETIEDTFFDIRNYGFISTLVHNKWWLLPWVSKDEEKGWQIE